MHTLVYIDIHPCAQLYMRPRVCARAFYYSFHIQTCTETIIRFRPGKNYKCTGYATTL